MPTHDAFWIFRFTRQAGVSLVLAAALMASTGCKRRAQAQMPQGRPPALVKSTLAVTGDVPVYLDQIGKCSAFRMVTVKPQVSGRVVSIGFKDGENVPVGKVLFKIDPAPYQAQLDQAKAQLAQANAQLGFAKVDFNRIKDLPRSVEPQSDFDAKQNAIDVASAMVAAAKAAIEAADVNLKYCTIEAPIEGLTGQRGVDEGNVVIANNPMGASAAMLTIQQLDPVYADFTVTESDLAKVQENMAARTLKTEVRLPSDEQPREGELAFLDNSIQDGAGIIKLRATVHNKDRHFWPGQFVFVRLVLRVQKAALLIPTSSIQIGQQGPFVYVVKADSTAELRPVVQGQVQGNLVVIEKGVNPGERVVVTGQMLVAPGGKVMELDEQAMGAPATGPAAAGMVTPTTRSTTAPTSMPTTLPLPLPNTAGVSKKPSATEGGH
jgi:multidrug efflux system membrane fusion protein